MENNTTTEGSPFRVDTAGVTGVPEMLRELVVEMQDGFLENCDYLKRLQATLRELKLPSGISEYAAIVRNYYRDIMSSIVHMMGMTADLMMEYNTVVHARYRTQDSDEKEKQLRILTIRQISKKCTVLISGAAFESRSLIIESYGKKRIYLSEELVTSTFVGLQKKILSDLKEFVYSTKLEHRFIIDWKFPNKRFTLPMSPIEMDQIEKTKINDFNIKLRKPITE